MSKLFKGGLSSMLSSSSKLPEGVLAKREGLKEVRQELERLLEVFKRWTKAVEVLHDTNLRSHTAMRDPDFGFASSHGLYGPGVNDGDVAAKLRDAMACIKRKMALLSTIEKQVSDLQSLLQARDRSERRKLDAIKKDKYSEKTLKLVKEAEEAAWRYCDALAEAEGAIEFIIEETKGGGGLGLARAEVCTLKLTQIQMFESCLEFCRKGLESQPAEWKVEMRPNEWEAWSQEKEDEVAAFKTTRLEELVKEFNLSSPVHILADRYGSLSATMSRRSSSLSRKSSGASAGAPPPPPPPPPPPVPISPSSRHSSFSQSYAGAPTLRPYSSSSQNSVASNSSNASIDIGTFGTVGPAADAPPPPPPPPPLTAAVKEPPAGASLGQDADAASVGSKTSSIASLDDLSVRSGDSPTLLPTEHPGPGVDTSSSAPKDDVAAGDPEIMERIKSAFDIGKTGGWTEFIDRSTGISFWVNEQRSEVREEPPGEDE